MEAVDTVVGEGIVHAGKTCRKIRAREVPFSDKLTKAGCRIKVWRLVIRSKEYNSIITRTFCRATRKCEFTRMLAVSLNKIKRRLARTRGGGGGIKTKEN